MGARNQLHKEVKEVVRYAETLGFRNAGFTGRMHILLIHPNGGKTTVSGTPSSPTALRNARAQIKRIARGVFS